MVRAKVANVVRRAFHVKSPGLHVADFTGNYLFACETG
jgi:hypothetical protein